MRLTRYALLVAAMWGACTAEAALIQVDQFGSASIYGTPMTGLLANDPGPGGFLNALTYLLPFNGAQGDLLLTDSNFSDLPIEIIRYNGDGTLIFYAGNMQGSLAYVVSPPGLLYDNIAIVPDTGAEEISMATYSPTEGQPGYDASNPTYIFFNGTAGIDAPEPGMAGVLALSLLGICISSRKRRAFVERFALPLLALTMANSTLLRAQVDVTPFGTCVASDPSTGQSLAWFGYTSLNDRSVRIAKGQDNYFTQSPHVRDQPDTFLPGYHPYAYSTTFDTAAGLNWSLANQIGTVQVGQSMPVCPAVIGPVQFGPMGVAATQTARLSVVGNPTGTCSVVLSFNDANGFPAGPSPKQVTLVGGQSDSLDLVGSTLPMGPGHRALVQPAVNFNVGNSTLACQTNVEVFATASAVTAFSIGPQTPAIQPVFPMQGLASGQTLRVAISAYPGNGCSATLGFMAPDGTAVGATSTATLTSGHTAFLDLPSNTLPSLAGWTGKRAQIRPVVTASGACLASSDVFDTLTGQTRFVTNPEPRP